MKSIRKTPVGWREGTLIAALVIGFGLSIPRDVRGQEAQSLPEIPLTARQPVAARYAGMGGAMLAVADDNAACLANPATLGLVRGIEFAIGFSHQSAEREVTHLGRTETTDYGKTRLTHLGFAYPFPTYRGRFVIGFQYGRVSSLDSDFYKKGTSDTIVLDEEGIFENGGMNAYAMSAALQVSPNVTLGASGTILGGSTFWERQFRYETDGTSIDEVTTTDSDINGISGTLGVLVELSRGIRFGMTAEFPQNLDFDVAVHDEYDTADCSEFVSEDYVTTDEVDLPFRLGAGFAFARRNLVLAGDAVFTDWTQIDFFGPVRTADREFAYRETVELRLGGEYLLSLPTPVRVRAGYSVQPLAYRLVLTDFEPTDACDAAGRYAEARFDRDRQYLTLGVGFLLGETMTLDLAYLHGGYERSAPQASQQRYKEVEKDRRLLATLSLRLN